MIFEAELEKRILAAVEELKENFTSGQMNSEQYQRTCGSIQAFRTVVEMFPEIRKTMNER